MYVCVCVCVYSLKEGKSFRCHDPKFPPQSHWNKASPSQVELWVNAHFMAALTGSPLPFPSPTAHPGVCPFASSFWMLCFPSDLWFPVGSEECEAEAAFCFVTSEQKGKQRLAATALGFCGGLQTDDRAFRRSRAAL